MASTNGFPRAAWEADLLQYVYVAELFAHHPLSEFTVEDPSNFNADAEAAEVLRMQNDPRERQAHATEILVQHYRFKAEYIHGWGLTDKPRTLEVLEAAVTVPGPLVFYFKYLFNRARPSMYLPKIQPLVPPPGHPAYPSGHSTQFHLASSLLADLIPNSRSALMTYAWNVAVNRERAGLHYRSDSEAGKALAFALYTKLPRLPEFGRLIDEARREWS